MSQKKIRQLIDAFAQDYDLPHAARVAEMTEREAMTQLAAPENRASLDARIMARHSGEMLSRIRREYECIAFSDSEDAKVADRLRALEQLRQFAYCERTENDAPALVIRGEYV